jgi:hypothetical protein
MVFISKHRRERFESNSDATEKQERGQRDDNFELRATTLPVAEESLWRCRNISDAAHLLPPL